MSSGSVFRWRHGQADTGGQSYTTQLRVRRYLGESVMISHVPPCVSVALINGNDQLWGCSHLIRPHPEGFEDMRSK